MGAGAGGVAVEGVEVIGGGVALVGGGSTRTAGGISALFTRAVVDGGAGSVPWAFGDELVAISVRPIASAAADPAMATVRSGLERSTAFGRLVFEIAMLEGLVLLAWAKL